MKKFLVWHKDLIADVVYAENKEDAVEKWNNGEIAEYEAGCGEGEIEEVEECKED